MINLTFNLCDKSQSIKLSDINRMRSNITLTTFHYKLTPNINKTKSLFVSFLENGIWIVETSPRSVSFSRPNIWIKILVTVIKSQCDCVLTYRCESFLLSVKQVSNRRCFRLICQMPSAVQDVRQLIQVTERQVSHYSQHQNHYKLIIYHSRQQQPVVTIGQETD